MAVSPETKLILLLEPDPEIRQQLEAVLQRHGCRVRCPGTDAEITEHLTVGRQDAVLFHMDLQRDGAVGRLQALRRRSGNTPLILLCAKQQVELAPVCLRYGIDDYVLRPPDDVELITRLGRLLERYDLDSRLAFFQDELSKRAKATQLETRSTAMRAVLDRVLRVAPMRSTVLIQGESGVGKELVARSIHYHSPRRNSSFMALNCAAMPSNLIESELFGHEKGAFTGAHARVRGKFEIAHRGSLFLDEIAEMDPATQAKLLRVLEEREFMRVGGDRSIQVDVRLIAATNADLAERVKGGQFRQDLFYRLKVVTIAVPPLRERQQDLEPLIETFLDDLARANAIQPKRLTSAAVDALKAYDWPGNVRELKNLLESLLVSVQGTSIDVKHLPRSVRKQRSTEPRSSVAAGMTLADVERDLIRVTLEETGGNRTHSAALLGIGVRTLQRKIQQYKLSIPPTRRGPKRHN